MSEPTDRELLHQAIDGALTPVDAERLRERLQDAAVREEEERLRKLTTLVEELGPAEPPQGFADSVMAALQTTAIRRASLLSKVAARMAGFGDQLRGDSVRHSRQVTSSGDVLRWTSGTAGGGAIVAKKALWAVAGLAVIVILAFVWMNGTRTVNQGAEGTIGAANRAVGAQPTGVNAKLGNVDAFLQSDTFDRLIKDQNVRNLLGSRETCALLGTPEMESALKDVSVDAALKDDTVDAALRGIPTQAALRDRVSMAALRSNAAALREDGAMQALKSFTAALRENPAMEAALSDDGVLMALSDAEVMSALRNPTEYANLKNARANLRTSRDSVQAAVKGRNFLNLINDANFDAALRTGGGPWVNMLGNGPLQAALKTQTFCNLVADDDFLAAMKGGRMANLLGSDAFDAALKSSPAVVNLLADPGFQSAIKGETDFLALFNEADFTAALRNFDAMDAALKNSRR
jgi:hypothetical protein